MTDGAAAIIIDVAALGRVLISLNEGGRARISGRFLGCCGGAFLAGMSRPKLDRLLSVPCEVEAAAGFATGRTKERLG